MVEGFKIRLYRALFVEGPDGLHTPPEKPHPSYNRLSRYDETGLIWLLQARSVVALTEATAAIQSSSSAITIYRRFHST